MMNGVKFILFVCCLACLQINTRGQALSWQLTARHGTQILQLEVKDIEDHPVAESLQLFVGELGEWPGAGTTAMLGTVSVEGNTVVFQPTFSFRKGISYTAFWDRKNAFTFSIPNDHPKAELLAIYPSTNVLPANLLKIYLHFSAPMGEGRAYEHLTLINAAGDTVHQPFVPLQPELWSEDQKRLTLWLDPGRVKRGLLSHEAHGVVIEEREHYTLIIDPSWKDAGGRNLGKTHRKTFRVTAPDYEQPKVAKWKMQVPGVGTLEPLIVDFRESLDQALASRLLTILSEPGTYLSGEIHLKNNESQWHFYPEAPWTEGNYTIRIDSALEDLSGNNLNRPFDREIIAGEKEKPAKDFFTLAFKIKTSE